MNQLYQTIGTTKQAVHQYAKRQTVFNQKIANLVIEADDLREAHPGCGLEKMYETLRPDFIGRDRFIEAFME
jgi:tRNA A37 N6-isopentenylltransferase MiaA